MCVYIKLGMKALSLSVWGLSRMADALPKMQMIVVLLLIATHTHTPTTTHTHALVRADQKTLLIVIFLHS